MKRKSGTPQHGDLAQMICDLLDHPDVPQAIWMRIIEGLEEMRKWNMLSLYHNPQVVREVLRLMAEREATALASQSKGK